MTSSTVRWLTGTLTLLLATVISLLGVLTGGTSARADQDVKLGKDVALVESWPEEAFEMWIPPQQGRLEFSGPVRTASMTLNLEALGDEMEQPGQVTRLTRGESATRVLFRFPALQEGTYRLTYSAESARGGEVSGSVTFSLGPRFTAPGGGNHRHEGSHTEYDNPWNLALRVLLVISSSLFFFAFYRSRRGFVSLWDAILPRLAAAAMAIFAAFSGATTIVKASLDNPDSPLPAAFASPALWVYLPVFVASALVIVTGSRGSAASTVALVALTLSGFSSQHGDQSWAVIATLALTLLLLVSSLMLTAAWVGASNMLSSSPRPAGKMVGVSALLGAVVAVLSLSMTVAHARGFTFYGDLATDMAIRGVAVGVLAVGLLLLAVCTIIPRVALRRVAVVLPVVVILAATAALLWVPPPTSGL